MGHSIRVQINAADGSSMMAIRTITLGRGGTKSGKKKQPQLTKGQFEHLNNLFLYIFVPPSDV